MSGRLDDEKLETLRSWGAGLAGEGRDELRAAGKAILILVEEIERLQVDVWHARGAAHDGVPRRDGAPPPTDGEAEAIAEDSLSPAEPEQGLETTLRGLVGRLLRTRAHESR